MKIKNISLSNFAKYDQVNVSFDNDITYLIGKNGSGKSTLGITAIWFLFQGIAEKSSGGNNPLVGERFRFIGPKAATAKGEMILLDEQKGVEIKVIRKLTKTGSDLSFEAPEGIELNQQWLTDLFNIFLIAPKKFTELSPKEQAKALGIDTKVYDDAIAALKIEFTGINRDLKAFTDLREVEKVERVDVNELVQQKEVIKKRLNDQYQENKKHNKELKAAWEKKVQDIKNECSDFNAQQDKKEAVIVAAKDYQAKLQNLGYEGTEVSTWINSLPVAEKPRMWFNEAPEEPTYKDELPDNSELTAIDEKIVNATEINVKALEYEQYLQRLEQKNKKEKELAENKAAQTKKEDERLQYIKQFKFPFSNLTVGEDGELLLNGKPIKEPYFSTGELLKVIPILISSQNPELKYVFLQDFNLLDDEKQEEISGYLTKKGFQLVVEVVGKEKLTEKNCILLKDNVVVESYQEEPENILQ